MSQTLAKGAARYAFARGLPGLINFAALALFTRLLTEREYGLYALTLAGATLGYAFGMQWLSLALLRLVHAEERPRAVFQATVLRLFAPVLLVVVAAAIVLAAALVRDLPILLLVGGVGLLAVHAWYDLNLSLATADREPGRYATLSGLRAGGALVIGGAFALAGKGAPGVICGTIAGYAIAGIVAFWRDWRPALHAAPDAVVRRTLLTYGLPLAGTYILDYIISTSDRLLLGGLRSPSEAGLYAPAYDLCQQSIFALMMVVNLSAYPLGVAAVQRGDATAQKRHFQQHFLLLAGIAIPAAVGLAMVAPSLSAVLGPRFAMSARELIPIVAFAMLLGGFKSYYFDLSFQLGRATQLQLITVAAAAGLNLVLNMFLIPAYGMRGAAWATLIAYGVGLILSVVVGRRVLALPVPAGDLLRITIAAGGMALVLLPLRHHAGLDMLAVQVLLGFVIYGLLVLVLNPARVRTLLHR